MWPGVVSGVGRSVGGQVYMGFRGLGCKVKVLAFRNTSSQYGESNGTKHEK